MQATPFPFEHAEDQHVAIGAVNEDGIAQAALLHEAEAPVDGVGTAIVADRIEPKPVRAERGGYVTRVDAELVGRASVVLGAGRDRVDDVVDPAVGIIITAKPGTQVSAGDAIFDVHYREQAKLDAALALIGRAITIGDEPPQLRAIIVGEVR